MALGGASAVVVGDYGFGRPEFPPLLSQHSRRCAVDDRIGGCIPVFIAALDESPAMGMFLALPADAATAFYLCVFDSPPQRIHYPILVVGSLFHSLYGLASGGSECGADSADVRSGTTKSGIQ